MLHIQLLGGFRLTFDGAPVGRLLTSRMQSLLSYLLLHRDAPQSRLSLALLLWPDTPEAQARTNLRKLLHDLRQCVSGIEHYLHVEDRKVIHWQSDATISLDVMEFQIAIDRASRDQSIAQVELNRAITLYCGDLLPDCYDEWIAPLREQLRHAYSSALQQLIRIHENRREYRTAITHTERLLQLDVLNEVVYRMLMRLHAQNGDAAAVAHIFRDCQNLLDRELGVEPEDETHRLYEQLVQASAYGTPENQPNTPLKLVGRLNEWEWLLRAQDAASRGNARCILISGEAGIGKTRLAESFTASAMQQGIATATARCYSAEGALPFSPVVDWLRSEAVRRHLPSIGDAWLSEVARLIPELTAEYPNLSRPKPLTEAWQRQRMFEALARAMLIKQPVLLFIDDLQWADRETLEWLHFLLRFDPHARVLLLGTVRTEEISDNHPLVAFVSTARREGLLGEIDLDPLNSVETAALAQQITGRTMSPDQMVHLYRETEGLPLYVVESMRIANADTERGVNWYLSPTLLAVIARRMNMLSADARDLVSLAAVIGRSFTLNELAIANKCDEDALVGSIDELLSRRIIREHSNALGDNVYDFSHDKIREVIVAGLSGARLRMLHHHVADALETLYAGVADAYSGQIAVHCDQAGLTERAIQYYRRAAEYARSIYANSDAICHYQCAQKILVRLIDTGKPVLTPLPDIDEPLGDVLHHVARDDEARAVYLHGLAHMGKSDKVSRARLRRKIGNTLRDQREYEQAMQAYQSAADELGTVIHSTTSEWWQEWIQVQLEKDTVFYWQGNIDASSQLSANLQPVIETHGTSDQRVSFYENQASREFRRNRNTFTDESLRNSRLALDAATQATDLARLPALTFFNGFALLWHGDPDQAETPLLNALAMAERTGDISLIARCTTYLTITYRQLRQVEKTQHFIERSHVAARQAHMIEYTALAEANSAWVAVCQDDWSSVHAHGQTALSLWNQLPAGHASAPFQWTARFPLIAAASHTADIATAVDHARTLLDPRMQRLPDALTTLLEQAILAWDQDRLKDALGALEQTLVVARQTRLL